MVISTRFVSDYKKLLKLVHVLIAKHVLLMSHYCTSTSLQVSQWFYFYTRLYQVKKVPQTCKCFHCINREFYVPGINLCCKNVNDNGAV